MKNHPSNRKTEADGVRPPIAWTISCSDSSGSTGIQADLKAMEALGVHACNVVTAISAANSIQEDRQILNPPDVVEAQIRSLAKDLPALAIKTGMLGMAGIIRAVARYIQTSAVPCVCDPMLMSAAGVRLLDPGAIEAVKNKLLPQVAVLTVNLREAEFLSGMTKLTPETIEKAAQRILALGPKSVLIKGRLLVEECATDYWTDGKNSYWLDSPFIQTPNDRGAGCALTSGITAAIALGYPIQDAILVGKALANQGLHLNVQIGKGVGSVSFNGWPDEPDDLAILRKNFPTDEDDAVMLPPPAQPVKQVSLCVDLGSLDDTLDAGKKNVLLMLENPEDLEAAIQACKKSEAKCLVLNEWASALEFGADGVILDQHNLDAVAVSNIKEAGVELGITAGSFHGISRAKRFKPSFMVLGPVFDDPQLFPGQTGLGPEEFDRMHALAGFQIWAIGGFNPGLARAWSAQNRGTVITTG